MRKLIEFFKKPIPTSWWVFLFYFNIFSFLCAVASLVLRIASRR